MFLIVSFFPPFKKILIWFLVVKKRAHFRRKTNTSAPIPTLGPIPELHHLFSSSALKWPKRAGKWQDREEATSWSASWPCSFQGHWDSGPQTHGGGAMPTSRPFGIPKGESGADEGRQTATPHPLRQTQGQREPGRVSRPSHMGTALKKKRCQGGTDNEVCRLGALSGPAGREGQCTHSVFCNSLPRPCCSRAGCSAAGSVGLCEEHKGSQGPQPGHSRPCSDSLTHLPLGHTPPKPSPSCGLGRRWQQAGHEGDVFTPTSGWLGLRRLLPLRDHPFQMGTTAAGEQSPEGQTAV